MDTGRRRCEREQFGKVGWLTVGMEICVGMMDTYSRFAARTSITAYEAIYSTELFLLWGKIVKKPLESKLHKAFDKIR